MATRSTIALEFADLTVQAVYCHWDGYVSNNGRILSQHWSDPFRLRSLIDQGDLSSLGHELGESHAFDKSFPIGSPEYQWCTFYGRDRGDKAAKANKYWNWDHYCATHDREQYDYCLRRDGTWWVRMANGVSVPLADLLLTEHE